MTAALTMPRRPCACRRARRRSVGHAVKTQRRHRFTDADLAALTFRIGPANMSGRFVAMDVVESDPFMMYVARSTHLQGQ